MGSASPTCMSADTQKQFVGGQSTARCPRQNRQRRAAAQKLREPSRNQPEVQSHLRHRRRERAIEVGRIQMPQPAQVRLRSSIEHRCGNRPQDEHREKRQLKTRTQQRLGIRHHHTQGRGPQRIQHRAAPTQQAHSEVDHEHQDGAPHGRSNVGDKRVGRAQNGGKQARQKIAEPRPAHHPEHHECQDADVHPGND